MTPPSIRDYKPALVVFLDVLGFSDKVKDIRQDKDVDKIYSTLKFIHDEFEKNITNEAKAEDHRLEGKTVLAFSDSVVISLLFESEDTRTIGLFDNMLAHLHSIALSQITCLSKGIFLRGGIAKGRWFRDGDIMISDALSKAYKMESCKAKFPILAIDPQTYNYFATHPDRRYYAAEIDPVDALFNLTKIAKNTTAYYLDYLNIGFVSSEDWRSENDRQAYLKAEPEQKARILDDSYKKSQLDFLKAHREAILNALDRAPDEHAKSKYRWLCHYHDRIAKEKGKDFRSCLIG